MSDRRVESQFDEADKSHGQDAAQSTLQRLIAELVQNFEQRAYAAVPSYRGGNQDLRVVAKFEAEKAIYLLVRTDRSRWSQLTDREREIVELVSECLSNKVIAVKLGISRATVAAHLQRIFKKLAVESRVSLVRLHVGITSASHES